MDALYYSDARVDDASLDHIVLSLVLFTDTVYVNRSYGGANSGVQRRLAELAQAGMVVPWGYDGDRGRRSGDWVESSTVADIENSTYREYEDLVQASIQEYLERSDRPLRVADLADISNELWGECLAAGLGASEIVGGRGRARSVIDKAGAGAADVSVVTQMFEQKGLGSGVGLLEVDDVLSLRANYRDSVGKVLSQSLEGLPPVSASTKFVEERGLERLLDEYDREVAEIVRRARPRLSTTGTSIAVDVAGFLVSPVGFYSIFSKLHWIPR